MNSNTLFGHLALQFSAHPENLATEALAFILRNSAVASRAFTDFLHGIALECPDILRYETQQVGTDESIPDMKCLGSGGTLRVIVENKFWAGLTDNQPVTYIRELPENSFGLLIFVVPEARTRLIWNEVVSRCANANIPVLNVRQVSDAMVGDVATSHKLAVTSWKSLLEMLASSTTSAADTAAHNDVVQLQGLCNRMDEEAFLPLRPDELTNLEIPRRIINLSDLPFDIVSAAEGLGYCNRRGLRATPGRYGSGTYLRIGEYEPWLGFDAAGWLRFGVSPLWLYFYSRTHEVRERLARAGLANTPRCFDFDGNVSIPIFLTAGVERRNLVEDGVRQLCELSTALAGQAQSAVTGAL